MKTIYITSRGAIALNENNEPLFVQESRSAVRSAYLITEPTHIVYNSSNKRIELDAEPDDILIEFYDTTFNTPIVVVNSKEWAENIKKYNEVEQKRKEEWAARAAEKTSGDKKD